jgi:hypothetical protein
VVEDAAIVIDGARTNDVAVVVVAELTGYQDGVSDSHGLRVSVRLLPRHAEVLLFLLYLYCHNASLTARGELVSGTLSERHHKLGASAGA